MSPRVPFSAVFLVGAVCSGCCGYVRKYPTPLPRKLANEVQRKNRTVRTLRAKATADQLTSKGRVNVTVYLLAARPGKLRFEATVMDNTVAVLTSDGTHFASVDFKRHLAYRGPASPCNIARIFQIPLSPDQVGTVLMGGTPVLRHDSVALKWDRCSGQEVITLKNSAQGLTQRIYLKRKGSRWVVVGSRIYDREGRRLLKLRFGRFKSKKGRWVPHLIHFVLRKPYTDVLIRFDKLALGVDIPEKAFALDLPQKLPEHWLTCPAVKQLPFLPVEAVKSVPLR